MSHLNILVAVQRLFSFKLIYSSSIDHDAIKENYNIKKLYELTDDGKGGGGGPPDIDVEPDEVLIVNIGWLTNEFSSEPGEEFML